jgi:MSHA biogenesis protein MshK
LFCLQNANANSDPTKPFNAAFDVNNAEIEAEKLVLQTIIHGDGVHTVIINGKVMSVGESIGEYKLMAVNDKSVVLRSENESKKLHVFSQAIVK